ncbi:MAG: DUF3293 domain-containing protein [Cyanobacteria bacterium J06634_5]
MANNSSKPKVSLEAAYTQAVYEVFIDSTTLTLQINQASAALNQYLHHYQKSTWTLITADNPYSRLLSDAENHQRHCQLLAVVEPLCLPTFDAVGRDRTGHWKPEKSLCIFGISQVKAMELGSYFNQNAILYGELESPAQLLWLHS